MTSDAADGPGRPLRCAVLLAVLAAALFAPTLSYDFAWDDEILIQHNSQIKAASNVSRFFTSDYSDLSHHAIMPGLYRPLLALSFFLDYQAWGLNPAGFHLTNVLLHVIVTVLVYLLARQLSGCAAFALMTGLIFAIHPIHTETVAFISARVDLLAALGFYDSRVTTDPLDPHLGVALAVLYAAGLVLAWARTRARMVYAGGLWFFLTLLPAANLIVIPGTRAAPMADRYLYLPSVGAAMVLAGVLTAVAARVVDRVRLPSRTAVSSALLIVLLAYLPPTLYWSGIWRDNLRLYEHMVRTSPSAVNPHLNLGVTYVNHGMYAKARGPLEQAIRLEPHAGAAYTALAKVYEAQGQWEEAMVLFRGGYAAAPTRAPAGTASPR